MSRRRGDPKLTTATAAALGWAVQGTGNSWSVRDERWRIGVWFARRFATEAAAVGYVEEELARHLGVSVEEFREHLSRVQRAKKEAA
jgi:hypothetical protein